MNPTSNQITECDDKKQYPNARDCQHGQLRRSCPHCEYDRDMAEAQEKIDQLQRQNDELKAGLAKLVELITDAYRSYTDHEGDDVGAFRNIVSAVSHIVDYELEGISTQSLQHIEVAGIERLKFPTMLRKMWSGGEVQEWLKEQAEQLRQQSTNDRSDEK